MDDDDNTTYFNNTTTTSTISSISFINNHINSPDPPPHHHQHQKHLPFPSTSSTSSSATHTTTSYSKPDMEQVWNDLNLVPLNEGLSLNNNNNNKTPPNTSTVFGVHDFLGGSNNTRDLQCSRNGEINRSVFGSHSSQMQQQQQLFLGPVLNLNSSPGLEFLVDNFDPLVISSNSDQIMIQPNPISSVDRVAPHEDHRFMNDEYSSSFQALASSTRLTTVGRRRLHENATERRRKRKIKNRESAARSRARREAYTNELEIELSHLLSENSKLKKQREELSLVVDAHVAGRHVLHRSSTAPF